MLSLIVAFAGTAWACGDAANCRVACALDGSASACAKVTELSEGADGAATLASGAWALACRHGEESACTALGTRYAAGTGLPKDANRASELVLDRCASAPMACAALGAANEGLAEQVTEALTSSCKKNAMSCLGLARLKAQKSGGADRDSKSLARYAKLNEKACFKKDKAACVRMRKLKDPASCLGDKADPLCMDASPSAEAECSGVLACAAACDDGDAAACMAEAGLWKTTKASAWKLVDASRACKDGKGDLDACKNVGMAYLEGTLPFSWDAVNTVLGPVCGSDLEVCEALAERQSSEGKTDLPYAANAAKLYTRACGLDDHHKCVEAAHYTLLSQPESDAYVALGQKQQELLQAACDKGGTKRCVELSWARRTEGQPPWWPKSGPQLADPDGARAAIVTALSQTTKRCADGKAKHCVNALKVWSSELMADHGKRCPGEKAACLETAKSTMKALCDAGVKGVCDLPVRNDGDDGPSNDTEEACRTKKDAKACLDRGRIRLGTGQDAHADFVIACEGGKADACFLTAMGGGTATVKKGCELGDKLSCELAE